MNYIEVWDSMRSAIENAHNVIDLKKLRDRAESYRYALKVAGESRDVIRKAEELKVRAERRAGELFKVMVKQKSGEYRKSNRSEPATVSYNEMGIDKRDVSKWQRIASIPVHDFEKWMASAEEISSSGALRLHNTLKFANRESPALPSGQFGVIYADPPWAYEYSHKSIKPVSEIYPTMNLEAICDLGEGIKKLSGDDCTLFLWVPSPHLEKFPVVLEAWGFRYCTSWVWHKQGYSYGHYGNINHELLIIGGNGKATPDCDPKHTAKVTSVQSIMKTGHSEKPEEFYAIIEGLYPERNYLELFSRATAKRPRWTYWGDEV